MCLSERDPSTGSPSRLGSTSDFGGWLLQYQGHGIWSYTCNVNSRHSNPDKRYLLKKPLGYQRKLHSSFPNISEEQFCRPTLLLGMIYLWNFYSQTLYWNSEKNTRLLQHTLYVIMIWLISECGTADNRLVFTLVFPMSQNLCNLRTIKLRKNLSI